METYIRLGKITSSGKTFYTSNDISVLLEIESVRTRENIIKNLLSSKILTQLERGKYFLTSNKPSNYEISQFIYSPSYISLESALNIYGVLSQFPFETTAVTLKKPISKVILGETFAFSQFKKDLFTGYEKKDNYLLATPEKALFDYLYLVTKAIKTDTYLDEMDFRNINREILQTYLNLTKKPVSNKINYYINKYL